MEQLQEAQRAVVGWYTRDESKPVLHYIALALWCCALTLNCALIGYLGSQASEAVVRFVGFVLFWFLPVTGATTYWLTATLRQLVLSQCLRQQVLQGATLEIAQQ